ncbi:MAG: hypothetical protein KUL75_08750 [Sterolibacterium sp.]|nr:hypothetical protein [Sterolibacterium sp.]
MNTPLNKQMTAAQAVAGIKSGMTVGIGGWGPRRKPMALVREILRSDIKDLTIVAYGGPEVGMLCAAGKVKKLIFGFVTMDAIPLEPYFRKAREAGQLELMELDEGMFEWGLRAAGMRMPFLPTRCGQGTDVLKYNPGIKTIQSPYEDGEVMIAMPALKLDVALLHVDRADRLGNTLNTGLDPLFDDLFARAADACYVTTEILEEKLQLGPDEARFNYFERYLVTGVVHTPGGGHPTYCGKSYGWDMDHLKKYNASAAAEGGWQQYYDEFIAGGEDAYIAKNGGMERISKLRQPIF